MPDPTRIYLQPECCAEPDVGRLWCEHDEPVECEDGESWTEYVAVDEVLRVIDEYVAALESTNGFRTDPFHADEVDAARLCTLRALRTRFEGGTDGE